MQRLIDGGTAGSAVLSLACFDGTDGLRADRRQGWGPPVEGVAPSVTCNDTFDGEIRTGASKAVHVNFTRP
jgi:hypothetical protein